MNDPNDDIVIPSNDLSPSSVQINQSNSNVSAQVAGGPVSPIEIGETFIWTQ